MNSSEIIKIYDIFSGTLGEEPLWILAVSGLATSIGVMNRLASERPGSYFVFDAALRSVVAQTGPRAHFAA
jgi:hypothetical protein